MELPMFSSTSKKPVIKPETTDFNSPIITNTYMRSLMKKGETSWLSTAELNCILINHKVYGMKLHDVSPQHPPSGSFYLYDKKVVKYFRQDGHNWTKRAGSNAIKEAHMKIQLDGKPNMHCYYCSHRINPAFRRRVYWLIENPKIVLVHYLEEGSKGKPRKASSHLVKKETPPQPPTVTIVEFCPETSMCTGGTKLIMCVDQPIDGNGVFIVFGKRLVPAQSVNHQTLKCIIPESLVPCEVSLKLQFRNTLNTITFPCTFKYTANSFRIPTNICATPPPQPLPLDGAKHCAKLGTKPLPLDGAKLGTKKRAAKQLTSTELLELNPREFKTRIVERVGAVDCAMKNTSPVKLSTSHIFDDEQLENIDDESVSKLSAALVSQAIQQLVDFGRENNVLDEINSLDDDGFSLFHYVILYKNLELVKMLLSNGAILHSRTSSGDSPLHLAAQAGLDKIVELLLSKGADPSAMNKEFQTPFDKANLNGYGYLSYLLQPESMCVFHHEIQIYFFSY